MTPPAPTRELLLILVRRAMGRGLPAQEAEDVVSRAWERVQAHYDPSRGTMEALFTTTVDNECRFWWRTWQRRERRHLRLLNEPQPRPDSDGAERAAALQRKLIAALDDDERRVFALWALQRHLPRGTLTAADAAARLNTTTREWENAKRRLKLRIQRLLDDWGHAPRDFFSVQDDERPRRAN